MIGTNLEEAGEQKPPVHGTLILIEGKISDAGRKDE